jgi:hypothetical protein
VRQLVFDNVQYALTYANIPAVLGKCVVCVFVCFFLGGGSVHTAQSSGCLHTQPTNQSPMHTHTHSQPTNAPKHMNPNKSNTQPTLTHPHRDHAGRLPARRNRGGPARGEVGDASGGEAGGERHVHLQVRLWIFVVVY